MTNRQLPEGAVELIDAVSLSTGFDRLAAELQPLVAREECLLLGVMNGGLYPLMELMRRLRGDYLLDYCHVGRYGDGISAPVGTTGATRWLRSPPATVAGRTVVVVDDIYDEGVTLDNVVQACEQAGADRVMTAVALIKDNPRRVTASVPDFSTGLTVPDIYVFGCGMDFAGRWRHLQAVYTLENVADGMIGNEGSA